VPTNDVIESIDEYCERLSKALHKLPTPEREDFIREVRSHILERIEARPEVTKEAITRILQEVGEPMELAAEYRTQAALREATQSEVTWGLRPWMILRATLRWGLRSVTGLVAFFVAVVGYGFTLVFYLCGMLKAIFPSRIGLWQSAHQFSLGYWNSHVAGADAGAEFYGMSVRPPYSFVLLGTQGPTNGPIRELLGYWLIPVGIVCGAVFYLATSFVVRWFITRFRRKKSWSAPLPYMPSMTQSR
jgi:uncharacterized membrane protein